VTLRSAVSTVLLALAWLAVAVLIALGAAGIVASMNHMPSSPARPELTWTGDRAAEAAIDGATDQLQHLADEVDGLSSTAREALTAVAAGDEDALATSIAEGSNQVGTVKGEAAELEAALAAVPGVAPVPELRLSAAMFHRYDTLAGTKGLTDGLESDWAAFTGRALNAATLTSLLTRHDQRTASAASEGSAAHYRQALDALDRSDSMIAEARELRDRLAATTDVETLSSWIDRNAAYDAALRQLYEALLESKGKVTDRVRSAIGAEQVARQQLPADTRALVVIMSDIAQGGLNQAVIAIEEARGALGSALDLQHRLQQSPELPG
jgi:alkylhydroperoxidase/carboxymuconolactone decarboxylase family protein YurZ